MHHGLLCVHVTARVPVSVHEWQHIYFRVCFLSLYVCQTPCDALTLSLLAVDSVSGDLGDCGVCGQE